MDSFWYVVVGAALLVVLLALSLVAARMFDFNPFRVWQRGQAAAALGPFERAFLQVVKDSRSYATLGIVSALLGLVTSAGGFSWRTALYSASVAALVAVLRGVGKYMSAAGDPAGAFVGNLADAVASRAGLSDATAKPADAATVAPDAGRTFAPDAPLPADGAAFWGPAPQLGATIVGGTIPAHYANLMDGTD